MALDLGTINYSINVDTTDLERADAATAKYTGTARESKGAVDQLILSNTKLSRATEGVTSRYQQLKSQIDPAYAAQKRFTQGMKVLDAELKQGNISLSQYTADMARLKANTTGLVRGARSSMSAMGGMRGAVQQAGYQFGDFAVQVGSGQSAIVAFSQQGAQMAGIFGPAGAVVGALIAVGGAIAGGFVRSMDEGTGAAGDLTEQTKELTKELNNATEAQARYVRGQFAQDAAKQEKVIRSQSEELKFLNARMERFVEQNLAVGVPLEAIQKSSAYQSLKEQAEEAQVRIDNARSAIELNAKKLKDYEDAVSGATDKERERVETLANLVATSKEQAATLDMTSREVALYKAELLGASEAERLAINNAYDKIEAFEKETAARKALMEATRISAADDPLLGAVAAQDRGEQIISEMQKEAEAVELGLDKRMALEEAHARRVESLRAGFRTGAIESEERLNELIVLSAKERNDKISEMERSRFDIMTDSQQSMLGAMGQMFGNFADIAKEGGEEQFSTWKAMASAQAVVSTGLAVANALSAAPPPFNFALAASVGAMGAVQLAKIQSQQYQGARRYGGQVQPNGEYLVGEDGPELVRMGGSPGFVTPNHKLGGNKTTSQTLVFQLSDNARREAKQQILNAAPMIKQIARQALLEAATDGGDGSRAVGRR